MLKEINRDTGPGNAEVVSRPVIIPRRGAETTNVLIPTTDGKNILRRTVITDFPTPVEASDRGLRRSLAGTVTATIATLGLGFGTAVTGVSEFVDRAWTSGNGSSDVANNRMVFATIVLTGLFLGVNYVRSVLRTETKALRNLLHPSETPTQT